MRKFWALIFVFAVLAVLVSCNSLDPSESSATSSHSHIFGEWMVVKEPNCIDAGLKERTCECEENETQHIDALGHTEVTDAAKEPTCTEMGLTEGKHCSACNEVLVKQEVVSSLGHTEVADVAKDPTCTETGLTEGKHCSVCNEVLVKQEVVSALGHTEVTDAAKDPTCTETGLTEGKHCLVCNEVLVKQEVVSALGHTEVTDAAKDPTCTETGLTEGKHCSVCNVVVISQSSIPATEHIFAAVVTKTPTCTKKGIKTFTCECGETYTEEIKSLGHNVVIDEAVKPTDKSPGLTEGKHCSVCGEILVAQKEISELGHTAPTIVIDNVVVAEDNSTLTFDVCVVNNPGIMNMIISMTIDDKTFGFETAVKGEALPGSTFTKPGSKVTTSPYNFLLDAMEITEEDKVDGVLFTITLTIKDASATGNYDITFSYIEGDIVNENFEAIDMQIENRTIKLN